MELGTYCFVVAAIIFSIVLGGFMEEKDDKNGAKTEAGFKQH
jgi:hypothetical protein